MSFGTLHIVATPIGNLADASPRALQALAQADLIACEDTRTSRPLLSHHGIAARVVPLHAHNERAATERLLGALRAGKNVSLISDAGTPTISDPGALLVAAAHREGIRVVPVPGPSAALTAYSASGFSADRFLFVGFLPAARGARRKALAALDAACPVIIYEAPHRVLETVQDLCERFGGARELLLARELTKKFEELARLPLGEAGAWLLAQPHRQQGEFVFVLGPERAPRAPDRAEGERVLGILLKELPASDAARLAARITGLPRAELYAVALGKKGKDAG
ncbi:MAG: 16S rRNA (cytidine(1402)-2'-O)-methyltransferase [Burkholderiales bacterium]